MERIVRNTDVYKYLIEEDGDYQLWFLQYDIR